MATNRGRWRNAVWLITLAAGWAAAPALAQPARLPASLPTQQSFDTAQKATISTFADQQIQEIESGDAARIRAARDAVDRAVDTAGVTVAFRLALGGALEPGLQSVIDADDAHAAAVALSIAGSVQSGGMVRILEKTLANDPRPAVRFAATVGLQSVLRGALSGDGGAVSEAQIRRTIEQIADLLAGEDDPGVVEGIARIFEAAELGQQSGANDIARFALRKYATALAGLISERRNEPALDEADETRWAAALLRGVQITYMKVFNQQGQGNVDREFAVAAGKVAAQAIAYVRDRLRDGDGGAVPDQAEQAALQRLADRSEKLIVLADNAVNRSALSGQSLDRAFQRSIERGSPDTFETAASPYIGENGVVTRTPYDMPASELAPR